MLGVLLSSYVVGARGSTFVCLQGLLNLFVKPIRVVKRESFKADVVILHPLTLPQWI